MKAALRTTALAIVRDPMTSLLRDVRDGLVRRV
jgi:hypothetical protein